MLADGRVQIASGRKAIGPTYPQSVHQNCGYPSVPLGVIEIDGALPRGGLKAGATHEWFAPPFDQSVRAAWAPPLPILTTVALRAARSGDLLVWVGRRCWPMPGVLGPAMARSVLVDPEGD